MDEVKADIRVLALKNALEHEGQANPKAVLGKLMAFHPGMRSRARELVTVVGRVSEEVSSMDTNSMTEELLLADPAYFEEDVQSSPKTRTELPPLAGGDKGVIMRFAPGPSGPLHVGHTRAVILNDEYVKRYDGKLIIRLEDTNPERIDPDAYESIMEDLRWLGVEYHEVICQSDRFDLYIEHAWELIRLGVAYVCTCDVEDWRREKLEGRPCPHRELLPRVHEGEWSKMLDGTYRQNEASLVIKTDLNHKNPAVRDFVAMRVNETPHPRTGTRYRVYPLYNYSVAVDDHLMGCTHILRGNDHLNNTLRQEYVFRYFGWELPRFHHYGLISIKDTVLKTSIIRDGIASGRYEGWDDMQLGTLKAMAKRGIGPEAFRKYWKDVGTKPVDVTFSWENLFAYNKNIVDPVAKRFFFVRQPVKLVIEGTDELTGRAPLHPDRPEMGERITVLSAGDDGSIEVLLDAEDAAAIRDMLVENNSVRIRLKDLCNVTVRGDDGSLRSEFEGNDLKWVREGARIIHWVAADNGKNLPCRVYRPDGIHEGVSEAGVRDAHGEVVQFERYGFVSVNDVGGKIAAYFAHK